MKKNILIISLVLILSIALVLILVFNSNSEPEPDLDLTSLSGRLMINNPGLEPGLWYLSYEKPGSPGLFLELTLAEDWTCQGAGELCDQFKDYNETLTGLAVEISGYQLTERFEIKQIIFQELETSLILNQEKPSIVTLEFNLEIPWALAFTPAGGKLITERAGRLIYLNPQGIRQEITLPAVNHFGEGGLLGLALHPNFQTNQYLYLYLTAKEDSAGNLFNQVIRYRFDSGELLNEQVIVDNIPGAKFHNGGRLSFGPDGYLYITTGDAGDPALAQDLDSLAGKILRLTAEGNIPSDNPWPDSPVFSLGHRNPQGLAWDDAGRLFSSEHGPIGFDEINLITAGGNFGWPRYKGREINEAGVDLTIGEIKMPAWHSGPDPTLNWAPGGLAFWDNSLWFGGLRGESLYEAILIDGEIKEIKTHLHQAYGRIRMTKIGVNDFLYLTTSNRDGRGRPQENDDRLIQLDLRQFRN